MGMGVSIQGVPAAEYGTGMLVSPRTIVSEGLGSESWFWAGKSA